MSNKQKTLRSETPAQIAASSNFPKTTDIRTMQNIIFQTAPTGAYRYIALRILHKVHTPAGWLETNDMRIATHIACKNTQFDGNRTREQIVVLIKGCAIVLAELIKFLNNVAADLMGDLK